MCIFCTSSNKMKYDSEKPNYLTNQQISIIYVNTYKEELSF